MASKPKAPKPTAEETLMRQRQVEQLAKLDEEENRRLKGLLRMRLGGRGLLGGAARRRGGGAHGSAAQPSGGRPVGYRGAGSGGGGGVVHNIP